MSMYDVIVIMECNCFLPVELNPSIMNHFKLLVLLPKALFRSLCHRLRCFSKDLIESSQVDLITFVSYL